MASKKGKRLTVRFDDDFYGEVETYREEHKIKTWNKALHLRDKENLKRIEELTSEKKKAQSIFDYMQKKGLSEDTPLDKDMSIPTSTELSEEACEFMVYVKREPKCGDPDSPIDSYLKRHLNPQICMLCQKLKNQKTQAIQKKQDEEKEKQLQKLREQSHKHMNSIKKTLGDDFKGEPRVDYDTSNPNGEPIW